ncbi:MAG TPA: hypothetical protein VJZ31_00505 [Bacilli bacterium]|nr:hypothetical protein [Bacilli bacterium]
MDDKQIIFEPVNQYEKVYKDQHSENVKNYFEELVKRAGVNEEVNAQTVQAINLQKKKIGEIESKLGKKRGLKTFLIVLIVLLFLAAGFFIYDLIQGQAFPPIVGILTIIFGIGGAIALIFVIVKKINPKIKNFQALLNKERELLETLISTAWSQVRALNDLFDWSMPGELIEKTVPLLDFDPYFNAQRADYMANKYGLDENLGIDYSIEFVQSGQIFGNPFLLLRTLNHNLATKVYTGTLTITWTETIRVNNKTQVVTRTQTLTASVTKPCPYYRDENYVVYCNDAAPNLSFSRKPSKANSLNDKEIERYVRRNEDDLIKMTQKAIKKGQSFQAMSNAEFELLFGALDRDKEIEYRLLFTPLAQREILNVIKDKKSGFGDDFNFVKRKQVNYIIPEHLQSFDMDGSPDNYIHYDLKTIRINFNKYNNDYFRHFYFAMAPLLAIPLYQQHKPLEYIYKDVYPQKLASYEHEAHVNAFDINQLRHPDSRTRNVLKTKVIGHDENLDQIEVTAYGYQTFERTDYIMMHGGDGRTHRVPVNWVEYIPVNKQSQVYIKVDDELDRPKFNNSIKTSEGWVNNLERLFGDQSSPVVRGKTISFLGERSFSHDDNILLDKIIKLKD